LERESGLQENPYAMPDTNDNRPTREQIEQRAHQRYLERGCRSGDELEDWLAAEKELIQFLSVQEKPVKALSSEVQTNCGLTSMFLDFYGLREQPFGVTPDPAYLYVSRTHCEALVSLSNGIEDNRGFFALIAEAGMGKTTLLYQLMEELRDTSRTVLLFQTQCNCREFIEYILHELAVDVKGMSLVAMHGKLNEILFEELLAGKRFVLIVDEAQNLDDSVLETVRMLSNFETHNTKLLQIILAGQPQLALKLTQPRLTQLRQRISVLGRLEPFNAEETGHYIEHRLKVAGHRGDPIFDPASISQIARLSQGIPRKINNLCYNSLFLAYTRRHLTVTAPVVKEAGARLDMEFFNPKPLAAAASASAAAPLASAAAAGASAPRSAPVAAPNEKKDDRSTAHLTYDAGGKVSSPKWPVRSAILIVILLSGTLLLAILGRSESKHALTPGTFDSSSNALGAVVTADRSEAPAANYDAAPLDTGNGQVLTVVAGPQQTLKDLSLRYLGHFDSELSEKISSLNPGLKDPDHLEAGQLIRIPLPPGAMKKVNDTAEAAGASEPQTSGSLFARFTALLRERK
jgi:type II secretory pathway predicted ATPase ExeA